MCFKHFVKGQISKLMSIFSRSLFYCALSGMGLPPPPHTYPNSEGVIEMINPGMEILRVSADFRFFVFASCLFIYFFLTLKRRVCIAKNKQTNEKSESTILPRIAGIRAHTCQVVFGGASRFETLQNLPGKTS